MNTLKESIKANSPFRLWIVHRQGSRTPSNELPLAQFHGKPNLRWAAKTIQTYRTAEVERAHIKENGIVIGDFDAKGNYRGKYQ